MSSGARNYSVVIVDDEALARAGLHSLIDWDEHGFEIVGEAENGEEGRRLIGRTTPDLAFVDIRMPVLGGLELIAALRELSPHTTIVVLSAYDDFAYARKAMQFGVFDYLLKLELTAEQLSAALGRVREALETSPHSPAGGTRGEPAAERVNLAGVLTDRVSPEAVQRLFESADADVVHYAIVVQLSGRSIPDAVSRIFINILEDEVETRAAEMSPGLFGVVVSLSATLREPGRRKSVRDFLSRSRVRITSYFEVSVTAVAEGPVAEVTRLSAAYSRSHDRMFGSTALRRGSVQFADEDQAARLGATDSGADRAGYGEIVRQLEGAFRAHDQHAARVVLSELLSMLGNASIVDRNALTSVCTEIIHQVDATAKKPESHDEVWGQPFLELGRLVYVDDFIEWIRRIRDDLLPKTLGARHHPLVESAVALIRSRYSENLTLEDAAMHLSTSDTYLSRLFRKELDQTFGEFLTSVRLAHAQELLEESTLSIAAIAERVGYENAYYFSRVFKRNLGSTPSEYRRTRGISE